jgi:cold shock CspA family protein
MGRSQETFSKKEVRNKKEKKRKDKEAKRMAKRDNVKPGQMGHTVAYLDEFGNLSDTPPDPLAKKKEISLESMEIGTPKRDARNEDPVRKGQVTFYNDSKGYGFIKDSETQESIFVHVNSVHGEITEGDRVSFEVTMGPKGPSAVEVRVESA